MRTCKCCGNTNESELSRHHLFPRRYFGNRKRNKIFVDLCGLNSQNNCHFRLEEFITQQEGGVRQDKGFYLNCLLDFLSHERRTTVSRPDGGMVCGLVGNNNTSEL